MQREALINSAEFLEKLKDKEKVHKIIFEGRTLWLKKAEKKQRTLLLNITAKISGWMKAPLLTPAKKYGPEDSINYEVEHLNTLSDLGFNVPEVIAKGDDWLLISDMGRNASGYFKNKERTSAEIETAYASILAEMSKLHSKGGFLSQAFVRNVTFINEDINKVGFIDFEDNPLTVSTAKQAIAKDLLYFTSSMARFFIQNSEAFKAITNEYLCQYDPEVIELFKATRQKLEWILKLPFKDKLGKDYKKLKVFLEATA